MALETRFAKRRISTSPKTQADDSKKTFSPKRTAKISYDEYNNMIRVKAYEIYTKRSSSDGNPLSDWVKAEEFVKKNLTKNGIYIA